MSATEKVAELSKLRRELNDAMMRRHEALHKCGSDSSQFAAASKDCDVIRRRIAEIENQFWG